MRASRIPYVSFSVICLRNAAESPGFPLKHGNVHLRLDAAGVLHGYDGAPVPAAHANGDPVCVHPCGRYWRRMAVLPGLRPAEFPEVRAV